MADALRSRARRSARRGPSQALYRTRQVIVALRPRLDATDLDFARERLTDGESRLFFSMEKRDQRHAIEVARRLEAGGIDDADLLAAALLHDCGKGAVPVWLRIAKVLSPGLLRLLASETSDGARGAAYRLLEHASLGARLAADAGSSEATVRLIRGNVLAEDAWKLACLTAADDAS